MLFYEINDCYWLVKKHNFFKNFKVGITVSPHNQKKKQKQLKIDYEKSSNKNHAQSQYQLPTNTEL